MAFMNPMGRSSLPAADLLKLVIWICKLEQLFFFFFFWDIHRCRKKLGSSTRLFPIRPILTIHSHSYVFPLVPFKMIQADSLGICLHIFKEHLSMTLQFSTFFIEFSLRKVRILFCFIYYTRTFSFLHTTKML